ncbi:MAG: hypothetical protein K0R57_2751 [Paenibacillaceae bacterium]|jgi:radical SAM protein with 4Fe4S-binding SPASM domain|nr:hypothetical protein [Paenibacillaceae bacterium]
MIKRLHSPAYNFVGDSITGMTLRWGEIATHNPVQAPWPELADISISNYCTKGCDFCYRDSTAKGKLMSVEEYGHVLDELTHPEYGPVFQVALGGGEPLEHPQFLEIIQTTVDKGIIPNFTTNGMPLTAETASRLTGLVGAVAISAGSIRQIDRSKLELLMDADIKANIHFVLSDSSIDDAVELLEGKHNELLDGVNGLIFLTYKPRGRAGLENVLQMDERFHRFLSLAGDNRCQARIGFDACFVPPLLHYTSINPDTVDSCECGFFSIYVDEHSTVKPCSFSNNDQYSYNLKELSFYEIWTEKLEGYRTGILARQCTAECASRSNCRGTCPYYPALQFCSE